MPAPWHSCRGHGLKILTRCVRNGGTPHLKPGSCCREPSGSSCRLPGIPWQRKPQWPVPRLKMRTAGFFPRKSLFRNAVFIASRTAFRLYLNRFEGLAVNWFHQRVIVRFSFISVQDGRPFPQKKAGRILFTTVVYS